MLEKKNCYIFKLHNCNFFLNYFSTTTENDKFRNRWPGLVEIILIQDANSTCSILFEALAMTPWETQVTQVGWCDICRCQPLDAEGHQCAGAGGEERLCGACPRARHVCSYFKYCKFPLGCLLKNTIDKAGCEK